MTRFAEGTSVSVEKTRAEIERLVVRYGANQFVTGGSRSALTSACTWPASLVYAAICGSWLP